MNIPVTGASGFVGRYLVPVLARDHSVVAAVRRQGSTVGARREVVVADLNRSTDWTEALKDIEVVVHLAARVHVMKDSAPDPLLASREANALGTHNLALQSARAGIRPLILMSTIKVNGDITHGHPFSAADTPHPVDPYAISKLEAENAIMEVAAQTQLESIVLRPPLIYGPEATGNLDRLIRLLQARVPLPLASISNRRTMLALGNLGQWIEHALDTPQFPATALLGDPVPVSTADLVRWTSEGLGIRARLFRFPPRLLMFAGDLLGMHAHMSRLLLDLEILPSYDLLRVQPDQLLTPVEAVRQMGQSLSDNNRATRL